MKKRSVSAVCKKYTLGAKERTEKLENLKNLITTMDLNVCFSTFFSPTVCRNGKPKKRIRPILTRFVNTFFFFEVSR